MTPDFIDELYLPDVRLRQCAAAITDGHRGKVHFLPPGTVAAASFAAPAVVIIVLNFVLIIPHSSGINRNNVAVIHHTTDIHMTGNVWIIFRPIR